MTTTQKFIPNTYDDSNEPKTEIRVNDLGFIQITMKRGNTGVTQAILPEEIGAARDPVGLIESIFRDMRRAFDMAPGDWSPMRREFMEGLRKMAVEKRIALERGQWNKPIPTHTES